MINKCSTIQQSRIIHAELKNGSNYKYLWLGNDNFSDLYMSWLNEDILGENFESNEGKYEGMLDFDYTFSFTVLDEIKDEQSIIGMSFDEGLEDSEIVDYQLEDIEWD